MIRNFFTRFIKLSLQRENKQALWYQIYTTGMLAMHIRRIVWLHLIDALSLVLNRGWDILPKYSNIYFNCKYENFFIILIKKDRVVFQNYSTFCFLCNEDLPVEVPFADPNFFNEVASITTTCMHAYERIREGVRQ